MLSNARQQDLEVRHNTRFQVSYCVTGKHRHLGDLTLQIVNISATGIMVDGKAGIERGDTVLLHLPSEKDVEVLCIWTWHQLAGLQFDRPVNIQTLTAIVDAMREVSSD